MSVSSDPKQCPKCGGPIPPEAPQELCPKCLLAQASIPTEPGRGAAPKPVPPTLKEMEAAFPHLQILELIGQGGMGFVFKARQPKLERLVALKILPQSLASDPAFADRFAREGRVLARLNHPNIVTIHDFGQADGFFYLLMEFVDGVNLRQAMRMGRFTPEQALAVVPKICEALQFAHNEGILHRDIKPENILLDAKGRVKIADFGIAKLVHEPQADSTLTGSGGTLGTPHYMAPEQIERPATVDHRADIYSLGVVFYEMLTGELPLGKFQPPSQKVHMDVRLDEVVLHALEKEPARRYQQVSEVKTAVETIAITPGQIPSRASPAADQSASAHERRRTSNRRQRVGRGVVVGMAVFFLTLLTATVITFIMPETYRAMARVLIEDATPPGTPTIPRVVPYFLQTELELIQSQTFLGWVVSQLNLSERWGPRYGGQPKLSTSQAIEVLRGMIDIRPVPNTMLLEIGCFSDRPHEAMEIANAVADSYRSQHAEQIRAFEKAGAGTQKDSARLGAASRLFRVEIIDRAVLPVRPVRPNKPANIALGLFGGLVLGTLAGLVVGWGSAWKSRGTPGEAAAPPLPTPDHFWRRVAVAGALAALAMILLAVGALILGKAASQRAQAVRAEIAATKSAARLQRGYAEEKIRKSRTSPPGSLPEKAGATVFGPVIQRTVDHPSTGARCFLNFQSGNLLTPPPEIAKLFAADNWMYDYDEDSAQAAQMESWVRANNADVVPNSGYPQKGLVLLDGISCATFSESGEEQSGDDYWTMTAVQLSEFIDDFQKEVGKRLVLPSRADPTMRAAQDKLPKSFAFKTREGFVGVLQITGFTEDPRGVKIRYKLAGASPLTDSGSGPSPAGGEVASTAESQLVISPEPFTVAHLEPGQLNWGFKCFVPPGHLASIVFVRWTNGVPSVDPGFSAYYKVGKAGGIDVPFCSLSCYPIPESTVARMTNAENRQMLARWGFGKASGVTNAVQWNVNLGLGYTSSQWLPMPPYHLVENEIPMKVRPGHQRAFRLVEFDRAEGEGSHRQSEVELRIFLEPLRSPPIRMLPDEIDRTNYIAGKGLAGTMEETLTKIRSLPDYAKAEADKGSLSETNFYIGQTWFPKGDSITIDFVHRSNDVMFVKGSYNLVSADSGTLALRITTRINSSAHEDPRQSVLISKGRGNFELLHPHVVPGLPHVNMHTADHKALAEIYFGNAEEAAEEKKLTFKPAE